MDLFLVPNNPEQTVLVSLNGVAHYQVSTGKAGHSGRRVSKLQRPAESEADSIVAEIEWKSWEHPTVLRSPLLSRNVSTTAASCDDGHVRRSDDKNGGEETTEGARRLSSASGGVGERAVGVLANDFLYKRTHFSS
ncbi:hypothetical protein PQX77_017417 [Marasmius sp. AFHP31]|nr:hypothetical protein PQX77_017417 [Marasmius sp. AFHP31]